MGAQVRADTLAHVRILHGVRRLSEVVVVGMLGLVGIVEELGGQIVVLVVFVEGRVRRIHNHALVVHQRIVVEIGDVMVGHKRRTHFEGRGGGCRSNARVSRTNRRRLEKFGGCEIHELYS